MKRYIPSVLGSLVAGTAVAGELALTIEIPRLDVAEYHRPYVAAWIEQADRSVAANLAVWYDTEMRNDEGETWLKDLRQWWRRSGRSLDMPVDGVSGPTRPPGTHTIQLTDRDQRLAKLPSGEYELVVEASREVGGREVVRIPFTWNEAPFEATANGSSELGTIHLSIEQ